jgi:hypothetical protein
MKDMNRATIAKTFRILVMIVLALNIAVYAADSYIKGELSKLGWFVIIMGVGSVLTMLTRKHWPDQQIVATTGTFTPRAIAFRDLIGLFVMGIGAGSFATSALFLLGRNNGMAGLFAVVALVSAAGAVVVGRRTLRKIPSLSNECAS